MTTYIKGNYKRSIFSNSTGYNIGLFKVSDTNDIKLSDYLDRTITFTGYFHELNEMESTYPRVENFNVSVKEIDGKVVFLRKLAKGGSEHSFGIHVAKLAGMPASIVQRAEQVLKQLETTQRGDRKISAPAIDAPQIKDGVQLSFFQLDDPVLSQLRDMILDLDIDRLTPLDALNKLHDIRSVLTGK